MKKLLSLLLALLMVAGLAACAEKPAPTPEPAPAEGEEVAADSDLAYVMANGKMIIGYTVYEPMNYTDENGVFTGFDTELATLVCEKLGVTPEFVEINWDTKVFELDANSIDCIWNGMTITEDLSAALAMSQPYVENAQVVVMKSDAEYTDTASLIGKSIATEIGSAGEIAVAEEPNLMQAESVEKAVQTDCLMEVKAGTADAAVLDMTLANAMIGEGTDYADLVVVDKLNVEEYGVGFRNGSDIRDKVNEIFNELLADGTMQALAEKYGLTLAQ